MVDEIVSPNNWIIKAKGYLTTEDKLILPLKCILIPMHQASTSIEKYNKEKDLPQTMDLVGKMQLIQNIGLNVRAADKAYFNEWSKGLIQINKDNITSLKLFGGCINCLSKSLSGNSLREFVSLRLKELSDLNNAKIIHAMDSGKYINADDVHIVFDYYEEFLKLELLGFPGLKSLPISKCRECKKKLTITSI